MSFTVSLTYFKATSSSFSSCSLLEVESHIRQLFEKNVQSMPLSLEWLPHEIEIHFVGENNFTVIGEPKRVFNNVRWSWRYVDVFQWDVIYRFMRFPAFASLAMDGDHASHDEYTHAENVLGKRETS